MKKWVVGLSVLAVIAVSAMFSVSTFSHCQIPCGIYGDDLRFSLMKEHITTMEKSMRLIKELSADNPDLNTNQIV
ncbi:superoxide dismutase, partial [bacterium]|nr:superoxide dismutase [bacterium]